MKLSSECVLHFNSKQCVCATAARCHLEELIDSFGLLVIEFEGHSGPTRSTNAHATHAHAQQTYHHGVFLQSIQLFE